MACKENSKKTNPEIINVDRRYHVCVGSPFIRNWNEKWMKQQNNLKRYDDTPTNCWNSCDSYGIQLVKSISPRTAACPLSIFATQQTVYVHMLIHHFYFHFI
jgi:hypothetical protein